MTKVALDITGMTCAACSSRVEKVLSRVDGVTRADVNLPLERASLEIDGDIDAAKLIAAVERAGYGATLRPDDRAAQRKADEAREAARRAEERQTLLRFAVSALLSVPLVVGMLPMMLGTGHAWIGPWTQASLATGVMIISGSRFYREAWAALRGGGANMAVLVSLGTSAAYFYSLWMVWSGNVHGHLYFEAAAVVLTLIMLGKYLEARAKQGASAALAALGRLQPPQAERKTSSGAEIVASGDLSPGDVVIVRPGTRVPADGLIVAGASSLDESLVTGESLPVDKAEGAAVITGTVNGDGVLEVRVSAVGADTRLARMARLVEDAQLSEAPVQRLVDRVSAVFVPVIIAVAALTFLGWWWIAGDLAAGFDAAIAVLVIACPCALGLATPTALVAGTGAAAKAGILIRDVATLEKAEAIKVVAFDKTGTLTQGHPEVVEVVATDGNTAALLRRAAAIEARSEHPLARALVARASSEPGEDLPATGISATRGKGMSGTVVGTSVAVGNARMMTELGIPRDTIDALTARFAKAGTLSFVAVDGVLMGGILFADRPRTEAATALRALTSENVRTVMLTGDNEDAARAIAADIGLSDYRASLLPEDKTEALGGLADDPRSIAFVGDGLNDAPALAAAGLGIAMSSGTDVAREAAAITLMRPDLRLVPAALDIARRTRRTITHNLAWAFLYNVIGIPLAAFGMLSPILAGAAMAFSSVSVVTNSALLARWKPRHLD
ncbi:MAG: heavy metal translocating P-type ATPase [Mesorhizobium sp.]|nr:heavy metal translocating P-type ATPase [Mesorhizobium sp.]